MVTGRQAALKQFLDNALQPVRNLSNGGLVGCKCLVSMATIITTRRFILEHDYGALPIGLLALLT